jgi:hypothetical protein
MGHGSTFLVFAAPSGCGGATPPASNATVVVDQSPAARAAAIARAIRAEPACIDAILAENQLDRARFGSP